MINITLSKYFSIKAFENGSSYSEKMWHYNNYAQNNRLLASCKMWQQIAVHTILLYVRVVGN
jgi:hypothetical protein